MSSSGLSRFQTDYLPDNFWMSVLSFLGQDPKNLHDDGTSAGQPFFEDNFQRRPFRELCALRLSCRRVCEELSGSFTELHVRSRPAPSQRWSTRFGNVRQITVHARLMRPVDLSWLRLQEPGTCSGDDGDLSTDGRIDAAQAERLKTARLQTVTVKRSICWKPRKEPGESDEFLALTRMPSNQRAEDVLGHGDGAGPHRVLATTICNSVHLTVYITCEQDLLKWANPGLRVPAAVTSLSVSVRTCGNSNLFSRLACLPALHRLEFLNHGNLTDEHLEAIAASAPKELRVLGNMAPCRLPEVTDRGLAALSAIPSLTRIVLLRSCITSAGVKALYQLRPGILVYR